MQISKFTDLSLRVLMYLTYEEGTTSPKINDIADKFSVPKNHLMKVVAHMNTLGWIQTIRGRTGGLKLLKHPDNLRLGDVMSSLEHGSLINCAKTACPIRGECNLKSILDIELSKFYQELNKYRLSDVVDAKTKIAVIRLHRAAA